MQPALVAVALAVCAAACEAQGASRFVRGLASPSGAPSSAPKLRRSGDWVCLPLIIWNASWYDYDGDMQVSAGDCLAYPAQAQKMIDFKGTSTTSVSKIRGLSSPASFLLNETCGGYTVVEILGADQLDGADTAATTDPADLPPADLVCPENSIAARFRATRGTNSDGGSSGPSVVTTTTGRGAGVPVHTCSSGKDKSGALCYPSCRDGYSGNGPLCLTDCPSGYRNDELYCFKPDSYGRGVGTVPVTKTSCSKNWSCKTTSSCGSKEDCLGLCYNSCRDGYYPAGCNVCSPRCPSGMDDIGVSCMKGSYGRGVGTPMKCGDDEEYQDGLCYKSCPSGAHGVGPLCYAPCPLSAPYRLGVQCFASKSARDGILSAIVIGTVVAAVTLGVAAAYASWTTAALAVAVLEGIEMAPLAGDLAVALDVAAPAGVDVVDVVAMMPILGIGEPGGFLPPLVQGVDFIVGADGWAIYIGGLQISAIGPG